MVKEYMVISKEELLTEAQAHDYCFYNKGQITRIGEFVDGIIQNAPKFYLSIPDDEKRNTCEPSETYLSIFERRKK